MHPFLLRCYKVIVTFKSCTFWNQLPNEFKKNTQYC